MREKESSSRKCLPFEINHHMQINVTRNKAASSRQGQKSTDKQHSSLLLLVLKCPLLTGLQTVFCRTWDGQARSKLD
jgi:hypothetical protein